MAGSVALLALAAVTFTIAFGELPTGGRIDATTEPAAMPQSQPEEAVRQPTAGFASDQPPHPSTPVAMDPEERERPVEPPDATKGGGTRDYYIQVHSLRRTNDAEAAVADLRASDFEAFTTNEGAWQVVYVGPFTDRTSADAAARRLSVQFHCDPILRLPGTGPVGGPPARP